MCLFANRKYAFVAQEDIECYKVLRRVDDVLTSYYHQSFIWKKSVTYTSVLESFDSVFKSNQYNVERGFHSYMYQKDAEEFINEISGDEILVLVKCIIPKGSQYFVGQSTDWRAGYASDKIIFTSIIKEYKHKAEIHSIADEDPFDLSSEILRTLTQEVLPKPVCLNVDVIPDVKPNKVRNLGTKYITSILLFLTVLISFFSCGVKQPSNEIEKFKIETRSIEQSEFESDGHKYKVFVIWNNKHLSVVHDPDCECHSH